MKKLAVCIGLLVSLLSLCLATGETQAKDSAAQAELLAACQRIQQYLTLPPETSVEQRALVALNIAIAQSGLHYESVDVAAVLRKAGTLRTYLLTSDTSYNWSTDHWEGGRRTTYGYSGTNRTSYVSQTWDGAQWVNNSRSTCALDGDGQVSTMTDQFWDSSAWRNSFLFTYTYDGSGNLTQMILQHWSGSGWVNYMKETMTYSSGNLTTVIFEMWGTSAWANSLRCLSTYSGSDLTEWITQSWVGGTWVNQTRTTSTYNGSGDRTLSVMYSWQGDAWVNSGRYDRTYDTYGNEILNVYSTWTGASWMALEADTTKWSGGKKTEVVRNEMITPSVSRTQYTYDGNGNNTEEFGQDWSGSEWVNSDRAVYVYQPAGACGDVDVSGDVNIADVVYLVAYIFSGGPAPTDAREGDVTCDLSVNIADIVYLVNYIFRGGPAPCEACP